jgi:predicted ATPase/signal transduction histidine kinase
LVAEITLPMSVGDALALAGQVARQLAALHARGLVHGGVRPDALSWDAREHRAALLEAAAARPAPARAALPRGANVQRLVYAAPEQTGRLDAAVDARSDLYSLGVVLYQLLTGAPPFVGRDALEQIHWHIAGTVTPPVRADAALPRPLVDLVLRLLAKAADDRYQSALALAEDLAHCASAWAADGRIEPFALARHDRAGRLNFGSSLVGREREVAQLEAAFERCAAGGRVLVLVEGYAGIGKTALIQQLLRPIVRRRGRFITGKFDQVVRGVPFGALIQACGALVRQLLGESEERLAHWRARLHTALGANAGVLTEVIPEVEFMVGAQPAPPQLPGAEAQNRFVRVVQRFVAALATREHPLVLFLDDLQWADAATLALLEPLATSPEIESLMLLGAFRDQEAEAAPLLQRTLAALQAAAPSATLAGAQAAGGASIERLALGPLAASDLAVMVAEALHTGHDEAATLAALVHAKTGGNPFFAMQFLHGLEREGQLAFDAAAARWRWNLPQIEALALSDNVVDLMTRSIARLPRATQYLLTLAACIGNRFGLQTLAIVSEQPLAATARDLQGAAAEGLIVAVAGTGGSDAALDAEAAAAPSGEYMFLHDRVQQAAYGLIPPERQHMVHLTVGRLLRSRTPPGQLDASLFDIVHHLNLGRGLISEAAERHEVAALDLAAGRRAKSATAHETALALFDAGLELLGEAGARRDPRLAFELALGAAECRYLAGNFDAALAACEQLVRQAPSAIDRARVLQLRCVQYENMGRYAQALASGREALAPFGVNLPADEPAQRAALEREVEAIERLRAGRPIAELVELPPMTDAPTRMVMTILTTIWSTAYILGDPTLSRLISATLVRLSLEHGNAEESAYGYVTHAITVGALRADYRAADDYGRLALAVNRKLDDRRLRAKIYQQFHAHVNFWCQPVRTCMAFAKEAVAAGLDGGDFLYAGYAAGTELWSAIAACEDLEAFEHDYAPSVALIERLKNPAFADMVQLILAWARALRGQTASALSLDGAGFDETAWLARYGEVRFFACIHALAHLQLAALVGTADEARAAARRSATLVDAVPGTIWPVLHEFWHAFALARAMAAGADSDAERAGDHATELAAIRAAEAAFAERVPYNAENHLPQALLLGAERARLEGRDEEAATLSRQAVEFTAGAPLRSWQALAHEGAARAHARLGQPTLAAMHAARARDLFAAWGAHIKVSALEAEWPAIGAPAPQAAPAPSGRRAGDATGSEGSDEAQGGLDLASVLKATRAIGAEVELEALLARLLHIAIENAGAERGALVLEGDEGAVVHSYEPGGAAPLAEALEATTRVPVAIVNFVRRSGETVVFGQAEPAHPPGALDAARWQSLSADDDYLRRHAPRSLACLPVRQLARPVGVLYVEHRRAAGVFTPARLAIVRVLATQAAVALDNARLVAGLRGEVAERRQAQEWLAGALAEVERLRDELEAENSYLRRDLIANVSHDLRTPLVSLRGYLEMVATRGDHLSAERRGQYLDIALRQSDRLATLIDELFELARLDFKGITLDRERFAFAELAADVVQKFRLVAEGRQVALEAQTPPRLPLVDADLGLVERVLENLIGNALKHTPPGGRICVSAHAEDSRVVAEVRDSGPGIAPADLPHVFDRFYRGTAGAASAAAAEGGAARGAGLGLAIARRIVELHGGEIAAESALGEGARLWFSLPVAAGG